MSELRFQFLINDQPACIAGAGGFGLFTASVDWIKRSPESYDTAKSEAPEDWTMTREEWTRETLRVSARTWDNFSAYRFWLDRQLAIGDKLTIRILGPGKTDQPLDTLPAM